MYVRTIRFGDHKFLKILVHYFLVEDEQTKRNVAISWVFNLMSSSTEDFCHSCVSIEE